MRAKIREAFDLFDKEKHGTVIQECVPTPPLVALAGARQRAQHRAVVLAGAGPRSDGDH